MKTFLMAAFLGPLALGSICILDVETKPGKISASATGCYDHTFKVSVEVDEPAGPFLRNLQATIAKGAIGHPIGIHLPSSSAIVAAASGNNPKLKRDDYFIFRKIDEKVEEICLHGGRLDIPNIQGTADPELLQRLAFQDFFAGSLDIRMSVKASARSNSWIYCLSGENLLFRPEGTMKSSLWVTPGEGIPFRIPAAPRVSGKSGAPQAGYSDGDGSGTGFSDL